MSDGDLNFTSAANSQAAGDSVASAATASGITPGSNQSAHILTALELEFKEHLKLMRPRNYEVAEELFTSFCKLNIHRIPDSTNSPQNTFLSWSYNMITAHFNEYPELAFEDALVVTRIIKQETPKPFTSELMTINDGTMLEKLRKFARENGLERTIDCRAQEFVRGSLCFGQNSPEVNGLDLSTSDQSARENAYLIALRTFLLEFPEAQRPYAFLWILENVGVEADPLIMAYKDTCSVWGAGEFHTNELVQKSIEGNPSFFQLKVDDDGDLVVFQNQYYCLGKHDSEPGEVNLRMSCRLTVRFGEAGPIENSSIKVESAFSGSNKDAVRLGVDSQVYGGRQTALREKRFELARQKNFDLIISSQVTVPRGFDVGGNAENYFQSMVVGIYRSLVKKYSSTLQANATLEDLLSEVVRLHAKNPKDEALYAAAVVLIAIVKCNILTEPTNKDRRALYDFVHAITGVNEGTWLFKALPPPLMLADQDAKKTFSQELGKKISRGVETLDKDRKFDSKYRFRFIKFGCYSYSIQLAESLKRHYILKTTVDIDDAGGSIDWDARVAAPTDVAPQEAEQAEDSILASLKMHLDQLVEARKTAFNEITACDNPQELKNILIKFEKAFWADDAPENVEVLKGYFMLEREKVQDAVNERQAIFAKAEVAFREAVMGEKSDAEASVVTAVHIALEAFRSEINEMISHQETLVDAPSTSDAPVTPLSIADQLDGARLVFLENLKIDGSLMFHYKNTDRDVEALIKVDHIVENLLDGAIHEIKEACVDQYKEEVKGTLDFLSGDDPRLAKKRDSILKKCQEKIYALMRDPVSQKTGVTYYQAENYWAEVKKELLQVKNKKQYVGKNIELGCSSDIGSASDDGSVYCTPPQSPRSLTFSEVDMGNKKVTFSLFEYVCVDTVEGSRDARTADPRDFAGRRERERWFRYR